ncbi:MAG: proline--tRNA ligase [Candidatus Sumerlaeia bacterium]|nr:proline--tRNA ligase [Candidatus Sumerlaeia bacterium]
MSDKTPDRIPSRAEDFSEWYIATVRQAQMADYTEIKGCMVIKPYGFGLWELLRDSLDKRIKDTGHENAYFPLFVPESYLKKEAEHVEGFAPECAWVTHGGGQQLEERLAIRPTSEAIICTMFAKWVQSYRDLPILINQWANVVRWEKRTRLFLRTSEFLWQEGHTVHRTADEAQEETMKMIEVYREFLETELAVPAVMGQKSDAERFAGAHKTYTVEALMQDGWALQAGTSHNLGQHFAKAFDIKFLDVDNTEKHAWTTSWGVSTRLVGAVIMTHGDDNGLRLPPRIAPVQAVAVPIYKAGLEGALNTKCEEIVKRLKAAGVRARADLRDTLRPGFKFTEWEVKGVPVRIELGPRDLESGNVVLVRRDTKEKMVVPEAELETRIPQLLVEIQANLLAQALAFRDAGTHEPKDFDEFVRFLDEKRGFMLCGWDGTGETEAAIKEKTKATLRCIPLDGRGEARPGDTDILSGAPAKYRVLYARAY